jgi:hypothetical protein
MTEAGSFQSRRLVAEQTPYLEFSASSQGSIETVEGSETVQARAQRIARKR